MPKRKTYQGRSEYNRAPIKKRRTSGNMVPYRTFVPRTMGPFAQSESKYFESTLSATAIPEATSWVGTELDPATANTLVIPLIGSEIYNRIGRKISVHKISIRGVLQTTAAPDTADILGSPAVRLILYIDKQANYTQSQGEDLIGPTQYTTSTIPGAFTSFQSLNSLGRFRVCKDVIYRPRIVTAGTDGTNTNSQNVSDVTFKMTCKFKTPIVMHFATSTGSVADIVDNAFHLIGNKSNANFATTITYQCRAYFKDL